MCFFCEYCEIFKTTYFEEHLRTTTSIIVKQSKQQQKIRKIDIS